ncbi:MAG: DsrE family protein [Bacteroidales bacterium]|nr:DsrE family protein [Bacteroidales bacterium]
MGILLTLSFKIYSQNTVSGQVPDKLVIVWTSGDPYVAERVALMYTHAAKTSNWFEEVSLVIWGPSAKLISENSKLQEQVKAMQKDGVIVEACIACANAYNVTEDLRKLGYDVKGMGKPLTDYLKSGAKVLTF